MGNFFRGLLFGIGIALLIAPRRGQEQRRLLSEQFQRIRGYLSERVQSNPTLKQGADQITQVANQATSQVKDTVSQATNQAKDVASQAASQVKDTVSQAASQARDTVSQATSQARDTASQAASQVKDTISQAASQARDTASQTASQVKDTTSQTASQVKDTTSQAAQQASSNAKNTVDNVVKTASQGAAQAQQSVQSAASSATTSSSNTITGRSGLDTPLSAIPGMEPEPQGELEALGIHTTGQLLEQTTTKEMRGDLAQKIGISAHMLRTLVDRADLMRLPGVGPDMATLLEEAGVNGCKDLQRRNPEHLYATLTGTQESNKSASLTPTLDELTQWIAEATSVANFTSK